MAQHRMNDIGVRVGLALALCVMLLASVARPAVAQTPSSTPAPPPDVSAYRGTSQSLGYQGAFVDIALEVDAFWAATFAAAGVRYDSPNIVVVDRGMMTACGYMEPQPNAFYCPPDQTLYLVPQFLDDLHAQFGDFAPLIVFAHEWGHHVQAETNQQRRQPAAFELQADCLSGVFTRHARDIGLLDQGDVLEGLDASQEYGDFLPVDDPQAHGSPEDRVLAVMQGFWLGPVDGCGLPFRSTGGATQTVEQSPLPQDDSVGSIAMPPPPVIISPRLPVSLPLAHNWCFRVVDSGPLTFDQLVARFPGAPDAASRLRGWGWQASAYKQFGCDGPPDGEAGWIDISVHGLGSAAAAQEAADYFAAERRRGTSLMMVDGPGVGDYSVALTGPASNGKEFTLYATKGPWLVRVTGVSPSGIPFGNVRAVAQDVLAAQDISRMAGAPSGVSGASGVASAAPAPVYASAAYLPAAPAVNYAECFSTVASGPYSIPDLEKAFARTSAGAGAVDTYGWRDGAYVVFRCDDPPFGRAGQIEVLIHQFRDAAAAQQIASAVEDFHIPADGESRACDTAGPLVICVSGYAETGSPLSDVHFVLNQVMAGAPR
ncbi:MAG: neutral zinc metallopeptidase [Thermomicrobiales bacterium]